MSRVRLTSSEQPASQKSDAEIPVAAASLSRMVLAPVAGQLGNKRLMIVADGALHFVPFGALPVVKWRSNEHEPAKKSDKTSDRRSRDCKPAFSLDTGSDPRRSGGTSKAPRSVVVLADPVFMKNDERVKTSRDKTPLRKRQKLITNTGTRGKHVDRQLVKAAEDTGVASEGMYVPRLPGTRQEAEQIVAMVPATERRLALDFAASRETATSAELGQYRYVHFSTHGLLNSVHPELSGFVFSLVNERGEAQDGFLRAHEIFNLKLPAEVVVLSACQTGIGKNIRGEGLVSLTRGFMYAGAPRVIVSLWGVSDWERQS